MYRLLTYLSCCFLLAAGITVPLTDQHDSDHSVEETTTEFFDFPEHVTLPELDAPTAEEEDIMEAHKINWLPFEDTMRAARHVQVEDEHEDGEEPHEKHIEEEHQLEDDDEEENLHNLEDDPVEDAEHHEGELKAEPHEEEQEHVTTGDRDEDACPTNSGRGLTRLIINARSFLPVDRLSNILIHAQQDAEVRDLLRMMRSRQFRDNVSRLRATKASGVLRDYMCQALKLNHAYFIGYVRTFLNVQTTEIATSPSFNRRKGVRGLLQDLREALPRTQLRDLYRRQLSVDKELSMSVRRIQSSEFRRLLSNVRSLPEYMAVRSDLENAGVPLQQILNLVSNALGWGNLDLGSETLIATV